jgi:hypothetical protein
MTNITQEYGYLGSEKRNIEKLFDFINQFSDVIEFIVVTAGTEVEIPHALEAIPRQVFPVITEGDTVSFANVFPGTTAWTASKVYLTASLAGTYNVILRR